MNPIVLVSYLASSSIISHIQTMTGNHGCNGTFSYGEDGDEEDEVQITEMNADPNLAPLGLLNKAPKHSPVVERHLRQRQLELLALRIRFGELEQRVHGLHKMRCRVPLKAKL